MLLYKGTLTAASAKQKLPSPPPCLLNSLIISAVCICWVAAVITITQGQDLAWMLHPQFCNRQECLASPEIKQEIKKRGKKIKCMKSLFWLPPKQTDAGSRGDGRNHVIFCFALHFSGFCCWGRRWQGHGKARGISWESKG